jgi:catalase (peroxidase I)
MTRHKGMLFLCCVLQFLRRVQFNVNNTFQDTPGGPNKTVSFADVLVASGVAAVKQCSRGRVMMPYTVGRKDATVADDTLLPSTTDIVEHKHIEIFANMVRSSC